MSSKSTSTKIGHALAKVLRIKLNYRDPVGGGAVTRGESVFSISSADTYVEGEPTSGDFLREMTPSFHDVGQYFYNLFPFVHWIGRYNLIWLIGDLVAGVTIGAVVVPQGMAYAQLANLPVEYGLYTSFMGVLLYWFFATSKDITIGPVAVLSTITGTVVTQALPLLPPQYPQGPAGAAIIASCLSVIDGAIICFLGLARLGWIVEVISLPAISAFMTGSALNIAVGQVPTMMGMAKFSTKGSGVSSRDSTYRVVINILRNLNDTRIDAAMGLTALAMLYLIRSGCNFAARRLPQHKKTFFFIATLRTAFVILLYTGISAGVNLYRRPNPRFKILQTVPRGFQHAGVPVVNSGVISTFANQLPAVVIVTLIEHIAIAKSFGRVNNYTIDPSQELVAIGVTNLLAPFLGAYAATGSFSRTAIKSKAGVRTPFAGVITAVVVLLAIYALPPVFYYIPQSSLAAVIIHAVGDLITPPNTVYQFWRISPLEVVIFFVGVIVTVFTNIENGIYVTISVSMAMYLFRVFKARGRFLGKVKIHSVIGDHLLDNHPGPDHDSDQDYSALKKRGPLVHGGDPDNAVRNAFLPISHHDGSNPQIEVEKPYPGIFIYRFSEGFNYPNANHYLDAMTQAIFQQTRRTNPNSYSRPGDCPWNNPGPRKGRPIDDQLDRPTLRAVILDMSSVNHVDVTSVQLLIDVRNQLDMYAAPEAVDWHFACIGNRWTKRALASAGFGYPTPSPVPADGGFRRWKPVFSVAEIGGSSSAAAAAEDRLRHTGSAPDVERADWSPDRAGGKGEIEAAAPTDLDKRLAQSKPYAQQQPPTVTSREGAGAQSGAVGRVAVVQGLNRPLFHVDLTSALQSAIANVEKREMAAPKPVG